MNGKQPHSTASDNSDEENVAEAQVDYQKLAGDLIQRELERHMADIREQFIEVRGRIDRSGKLSPQDLHEMEEVVRQADYFLDTLRESME